MLNEIISAGLGFVAGSFGGRQYERDAVKKQDKKKRKYQFDIIKIVEAVKKLFSSSKDDRKYAQKKIRFYADAFTLQALGIIEEKRKEAKANGDTMISIEQIKQLANSDKGLATANNIIKFAEALGEFIDAHCSVSEENGFKFYDNGDNPDNKGITSVYLEKTLCEIFTFLEIDLSQFNIEPEQPEETVETFTKTADPEDVIIVEEAAEQKTETAAADDNKDTKPETTENK